MRRITSFSLTRILLVLTLGLLAARSSPATVAVMSSDAELTRSSRLIVQGKVRALASQRTGEDIHTYVDVDVARVLKGRIGNDRIVLRQLGGTVEDVTLGIDGAPTFKPGEEVLLFLDTWPDGALRVAHLFMGKYDIQRDARTGKARVVRQVDEDVVHLVENRRSKDVTHAADLSSFQKKIARILREQGDGDLWTAAVVEVPDDAPASRSGRGLSSATEPFVLLNDNGVFRRWFEPDSGQAVGFWFNLTQAPNGNAHNSLVNALNAWNNVETSKLVLSFAGYATSVGFFADFLSTISFEDPRGQLQDPNPFDCSGIVAGSAYVRRNNAAREVNRQIFYQILESDIVFNNGWTAGSCPLFLDDPTTRIIEEVAAHELGHSIGLGHSNLATRSPGLDPIMRSTVHNNGRGALLGFDDHVGATFIYPEPINPIDNARYFVGWHYRDWLEREPDIPGLNHWTANITHCGSNATCVAAWRINTALAFPYSIEFFQQIDTRFNPANRGTPAYNEAFVQECFERYWQRPKDSNDWVNYLNARIPNTDDHYRTVLSAFINNDEYRSRFDPYLCNPYDEQVCYAQGPNWYWSSFTCTCEFIFNDPCSDPFDPRCV